MIDIFTWIHMKLLITLLKNLTTNVTPEKLKNNSLITCFFF